MSVFKELVSTATKIATDKILQSGSAIKDTLTTITGITAGEEADASAKKLGLYRTNRLGEQVLKIPFFKSTDEKILDAFAKHPERKKICFHFENTYASLKKGVIFYDPDGNRVFSIPADNKNLKKIELYQDGKLIARIAKHITINLNPLSDLQKYDLFMHDRPKTIRVSWSKANIDNAPWTMKHKIGKDFIIENAEGKEVARFYSLGFHNFVFDYNESVDPAELLMAFMAIQIRTQETQENHRGDRSKLLGSFTGDIKDIF